MNQLMADDDDNEAWTRQAAKDAKDAALEKEILEYREDQARSDEEREKARWLRGE